MNPDAFVAGESNEIEKQVSSDFLVSFVPF